MEDKEERTEKIVAEGAKTQRQEKVGEEVKQEAMKDGMEDGIGR